MAARKARKSVLDSDPLACLKDDEVEPASVSKRQAKKKAVAKNTVSRKSSGKKPADPNNLKKKSIKKTSASILENNSEALPASEGYEDSGEINAALTSGSDQLNQSIEKNGTQELGQETAFGFFPEQPEVADDASSLSLGPELTIKNVVDVKSLLDQKLLQSDVINIELSDLHKVDTAGLQLLFAVSSTLAKTGQSVGWRGSDEVVEKAASVLGLSWPPQVDSFQSESALGDANYGFF